MQEIEHEAGAILTERRDLLAEVRDKEHATQRSVYHLEGMVGKLVEMRDFTGAFFNKISYLDTKLPVSQRRLALWMDKLQALQSQWFRTIGRYITVYAPPAVRSRFVAWERDIQQAALKARELRGEVGEFQLGAPGDSSAAATDTVMESSNEDSHVTPACSIQDEPGFSELRQRSSVKPVVENGQR
ncbi:hypothetical protein BG004_004524 [Podila humilis]|nr:hypothetical protein BG004_004524 [Podila humilis]